MTSPLHDHTPTRTRIEVAVPEMHDLHLTLPPPVDSPFANESFAVVFLPPDLSDIFHALVNDPNNNVSYSTRSWVNIPNSEQFTDCVPVGQYLSIRGETFAITALLQRAHLLKSIVYSSVTENKP